MNPIFLGRQARGYRTSIGWQPIGSHKLIERQAKTQACHSMTPRRSPVLEEQLQRKFHLASPLLAGVASKVARVV